MSTILFTNIKCLAGIDTGQQVKPLRGKALDNIQTLDNAWLFVENGLIADFGSMQNCPQLNVPQVDLTDRTLLPCWVDSHTHLVFAASREKEFVDRINGLSYEEIAKRGGGILNSAQKLRQTPESLLLEQAQARLEEVQSYGTGAIEIKSGYGLDLESELKMLRVIRTLKENNSIPIKATFLGAHALPPEYKSNRSAYIDLIINKMLPRIAGENLADYIDVFCEKVAFSTVETDQLLEAGHKYGLKPKIHTNQFNCMGGIEVAVKHNALSVDHLEVVNETEINTLQNSNTIATLLPSAPFFLNDHYPPARQLIKANIPIALATDFNPGSTPSGKMPFVLSLACIKMKMTPVEAINAATINGAHALELADTHGSIKKGKAANLIVTKAIPSLAYIPYAFGSDSIEQVYINGQRTGSKA